MFTNIRHKIMNNFHIHLVNKFPLKDMKVIRFILVGALNTLLGFFLFPLMYFSFSAYQKNYLLLLVISQIICMLFSFFSNKIYVFKSRNKVSVELIKFVGFHGFYFFVSVKINPMIVRHFDLHPIAIQTLLNILIVVTSFFWYDKFNFAPHKLRKI